jgi:hypothetical protein
MPVRKNGFVLLIHSTSIDAAESPGKRRYEQSGEGAIRFDLVETEAAQVTALTPDISLTATSLAKA